MVRKGHPEKQTLPQGSEGMSHTEDFGGVQEAERTANSSALRQELDWFP